MADEQELRIKVTAETAKAGKDLNKLGDTIENIGDKFERANWTVKGFATTLKEATASSAFRELKMLEDAFDSAIAKDIEAELEASKVYKSYLKTAKPLNAGANFGAELKSAEDVSNYKRLFDMAELRDFGGELKYANEISAYRNLFDRAELIETKLSSAKALSEVARGNSPINGSNWGEELKSMRETAEAMRDYTRLFDEAEQKNNEVENTSERFVRLKSAINEATQAFIKLRSGGYATSKMFANLKDGLIDIGESIKKVLAKLKNIVVYRTVRKIMSLFTQNIKEGIENIVTLETKLGSLGITSANGVMSQLQTMFLQIENTLASAFIPVLYALLPLIEKLATTFMNATNAVNQFFEAINGNDMYRLATESWVDYSESLDETTSSASKLKRQLMGFDELNVLSAPSSSSSNTKETGSYTIAPIEDKIKNNLESITALVSGMELALGSLLLFTGASPILGLGLMVIGATKLFKTSFGDGNWAESTLTEKIGRITEIVGASFLAVGSLLAFTGANVPLGISLMAIGATSMGSAIAINWDFSNDKVADTVKAIMNTVGVGLLAIGAIIALCVPTQLGLGLGLMIAGGLSMMGASAVDWNSTVNNTNDAISRITSIVGKGLMALGVIFLVTGNPTLGMGLLVSGGIMAYAGNSSLNWGYFPSKVQGIFDNISKKMEDFAKKWRTFWEELNEELEPVTQKFDGKIGNIDLSEPLIDLSKIIHKADGGTVPSGQLFIANEAGAELVGQVGGRTTVTNQEQFTQSLQIANADVINAVLAIGNAITSAVEKKDTNVYLDSMQMARGMLNANKQVSNLAGRSLVL